MKTILRNAIRKGLKNAGITILRTNEDTYGYNINDDAVKILQTIIQKGSEPVIFDIGSNVGQSIELYKLHFPQSQIHAFEPSPKTFEILKDKTRQYKNVIYNKMGVGAEKTQLLFTENEHSDVSSFLEPTKEMWGKVVSQEMVDVITIADYMQERKMHSIDFLKIDTQGFDFEVLKGAAAPMKEGKISLIQLEITLKEFYKNLPRMDEIVKFLLDADFKLVAFYGFHNKNIAAQWTDGLFIHTSCIPK